MERYFIVLFATGLLTFVSGFSTKNLILNIIGFAMMIISGGLLILSYF